VRALEKPREIRPSEKVAANPKEVRLPEKGPIERTKVNKPVDRSSEPSLASKLSNSKLIRPTQSRPQDRETAKPQASVPLVRNQGQFVPPERRSVEKAKESAPPVRTAEQPKQYRPTVRAAERSTPVERDTVKSGESLPQVRETGKPGYLIPQRRAQKSGING
jgi:hypothetical protein